jgi:membrane protease YdiL (CAAX protease family)
MTPPHPPAGPPAWTGRDIAIALFLLYVFWPSLSLQVLVSSGFLDRLYGPGMTALCRPHDDSAGPDAEAREADRTRVGLLAGPIAARLDVVEKEARRVAMIRVNAWANALAFPLEALTIPVVFYVLSGVPPGRLGLTTRRLGRNLLAGFGGWLLITPIVFTVNMAILHLYNLTDPDAIQEHALTRLARQGPSAAEWTLLFFSAVVAAPVLEETVFRGVLQPWFAGLRHGGATAVAVAFVVAVMSRQTQLVEAVRHGGQGLVTAAMPVVFVVVMVPFYLAVARRPPRPESAALFGTALLFGAMHSAVWPTPVPLFVLGLALGTLAARTGSLVGPMVLHGLFNGVTCVVLLFSRSAG